MKVFKSALGFQSGFRQSGLFLGLLWMFSFFGLHRPKSAADVWLQLISRGLGATKNLSTHIPLREGGDETLPQTPNPTP